ncbi:hypothetical protein BKA65DRAFT_243414 [Rhexocercosporidium sp. MPI-PUGE-AT-0058]|nr:hypothetical protein BKA65DRAFT_243414 [Rhexocercosporidium sp. MPI-PUGE-AT-0058]
MTIDSEKEIAPPEWLRYPANLKNCDAIVVDGDACMQHLDRLSKVLFSKNTKLETIALSPGLDIKRTTVQNEDGLDVFLREASAPELQIISISQKHSLSPLGISKSSLLKILSRYQILPEFVDVVSGFGDKQSSSDEVSEPGMYSSLDGSNYEISYQVRYMERNNRSHGDPWSLRQTGVYHKYSALSDAAATPTNLWILLHPMQNSVVSKRLENITAEDIRNDANPLRFHLLITSSYIDNWRMYLHDMTREFLELESNLMTSELRDREEYTMLNFDTLQTLRHLAGKLIPIPAILQASIKTIKSISAMVITLGTTTDLTRTAPESRKTQYHLQLCQSRLESYLESCYVLQARIENMTKFLADGLNLQNQEISAESNTHLITLTKDTVDDSATVRAITVVTLLYLPATFVSGLLGSNLFNFKDSTSDFQISKQFWIYLAVTLPLMLLTIGYWKFKTHQQKRKKRGLEVAQTMATV